MYHVLHNIDGDHAIERLTDSEDIVTDAKLDTNCVENSTLAGINTAVNIDHLNQETDDCRLLSLVKSDSFHENA